MKSKTKHSGLHYTIATALAIVTFVHAMRLVYGWPFIIGTWAAPMWLSWLAVLLIGSFAVSLWKTA